MALGSLAARFSIVPLSAKSASGFFSLISAQRFDLKLPHNLIYQQSSRSYAARAGKREKMKAEKKKRKQEKIIEKEEPFVPYRIKLAKENLITGPKRYKADQKWLIADPVDDVYCKKNYPRQFYETAEAIDMHREANHPTMKNFPDALLLLRVELNLELGSKKNRYLNDFSHTIKYPYFFERGSMNRVIAFCTNNEDASKASDAGAIMAGGKMLIQQFQEGEVTLSDFDHVVANHDILPELISIRGILRKHFPTQQKGNLGLDITALVEQYVKGFTFTSESSECEPDFGWVEAPVGRLDMPNEQIEENISALLKLVDSNAPKGREGKFVTQVLLSTESTREKFVLKHWKYLKGYEEKQRLNILEWLKVKAEQSEKIVPSL